MIAALLTFLVGALVLIVVVYIAKLVLDALPLPDNLRQIALLIVGLIGVLLLVVLMVQLLGPGLAWPPTVVR